MTILALDIGGANIKVVHSDGWAATTPFALWASPAELFAQLHRIVATAPQFDGLAVTMTAELCDCFETKRIGVLHVLAAVENVAARRPVYVWQTTGRFVSLLDARSDPIPCAASNWLALAYHVCGVYPTQTTLLVDTGSTTTDIVVLRAGQPQTIGRTDTDRLISGELVYLGVDRTSLMALGPTIPWADRSCRVMAEHFATTADVFLLTGDVEYESPDRTDTADGRPRTMGCAAARLLRMIGSDLDHHSVSDARQLAGALSSVMTGRLANAITQVTRGLDIEQVVVSGSGEFLAVASARAVFPDVRIHLWSQHVGPQGSTAACARALLYLLSDQASAQDGPEG